MSSYSEGTVHQLANALEAAGFSSEHLTKMRSKEILDVIKAYLDDLTKVPMHKHLIDSDADPFTPNGWRVESHRKMGMIEWNASKLELWVSAIQRDFEIEADTLRKEVEQLEGVLNANVLDYLLAHPELIPESWKGKAIFFWGTIYYNDRGLLCVRSFCWTGVKWESGYRCFNLKWYGNYPAPRMRK